MMNGKENAPVYLVSCVILAAGESSRMQHPKPLLPFNSHQTFIEKIIETYRLAGIHALYIVANSSLKNKMLSILSPLKGTLTLLLNTHPHRGRFYSIQLGLNEARKKSDGCFLQNVDNPFITSEMLRQMLSVVSPDSYVVPTYLQQSGHPVLIGRNVMQYLLASGIQGEAEQNIRTILKKFSKKTIAVDDPRVLANINTMEDYEQYFQSERNGVLKKIYAKHL